MTKKNNSSLKTFILIDTMNSIDNVKFTDKFLHTSVTIACWYTYAFRNEIKP